MWGREEQGTRSRLLGPSGGVPHIVVACVSLEIESWRAVDLHCMARRVQGTGSYYVCMYACRPFRALDASFSGLGGLVVVPEGALDDKVWGKAVEVISARVFSSSALCRA